MGVGVWACRLLQPVAASSMGMGVAAASGGGGMFDISNMNGERKK